jgi:hypothetical protein
MKKRQIESRKQKNFMVKVENKKKREIRSAVNRRPKMQSRPVSNMQEDRLSKLKALKMGPNSQNFNGNDPDEGYR